MSYANVTIPLPSHQVARKATYTMTPRFITFHNTANDASARNEIAYMHRNLNQTSFHYAVDDIEAILGVPENRNAWHCGDGLTGTGNRQSIGVEVCYSRSGGERYRKAEANAIDLIARLLIKHGLTPSAVRYHQEWSGKNCPHRVIAEGRQASVKQAIARRYEELRNPPVSPAPTGPKVGVATMLQDVMVYRQNDFGTQSGQILKRGDVRNIYRIERGWYQLHNGTWIPSNYGKNFTYVPEPPKVEGPTTVAPQAPSPSPTGFRVIAGTFGERANAVARQEALKRAGFDSFLLPHGNSLRVVVGSFADRENANRQVDALKAKGFESFLITV